MTFNRLRLDEHNSRCILNKQKRQFDEESYIIKYRWTFFTELNNFIKCATILIHQIRLGFQLRKLKVFHNTQSITNNNKTKKINNLDKTTLLN